MGSNKYKVLVVEDESNIRSFMRTILETNGYQVLTSGSCIQGRLVFSSHCPDLIILDLGLPDMDGLEFIRSARETSEVPIIVLSARTSERDKVEALDLGLPDMDGLEFIRSARETSEVPIIVLSARTSERDKVEALDMGANDYITKPFGTDELLARVRATLRNSRHGMGSTLPGGKFLSGDLEIDYDKRRVYIGRNEIRLTQTEYNIVTFLSEHSGKVLTYSTIIHAIWGDADTGSVKKLQVNMANIRKKFGSKPGQCQYILNELGVGYRMQEENERGDET